MLRNAYQLIGRKHAIFLALSLLFLAYMALLRPDTTGSGLAMGGGLVLAVWALIGIRTYTKLAEARRDRGNTHAR